jgi:hypothetical protein
MQPGDFAVIPMGGESGKLIEFGEFLNGDGFGNYEHAEIYVGNPAGSPTVPNGYTMGAYPGGAKLVPLPDEKYQDGWLWSTDRIPLTGPERLEIVNAALACKGIPYSAADYFALAAHRLHIPAPGLKNYIAASGHEICSQLVDYCYLEADVHLFTDNRWPGYVTPEDLANVLLHE